MTAKEDKLNEIVSAFYEKKGWGKKNGEKYIASFRYDEDTGCSTKFIVKVEEIGFHALGITDKYIHKSEWSNAMFFCNEWNNKSFFATSYLHIDDNGHADLRLSHSIYAPDYAGAIEDFWVHSYLEKLNNHFELFWREVKNNDGVNQIDKP